MAATITVQPAGEPITLAELKAQLRIESSDYNDQLERLIVAARRHFERSTNRSLVTRTYRLDLVGFPRARGEIRLPFGPAIAVASVSYRDSSDAQITLDAATYIVDTTSDVATVTPIWGGCWPWMLPRPGGVSITYTAGYGAAATVIDDAKHALLMIAAYWFETAPAASDKPPSVVPMGAQAILDSLKIDLLA